MTRLLVVLVLLAARLGLGQINWCIDNPIPESCRDAHGDPATIAAGFTYHASTDLQLETPVGPFVLERYYFSDNQAGHGAWQEVLGLRNLPRPFSGPGTRVQWWHSLFSFVYIQNSNAFYVTGQTGNSHHFRNGCIPPSACFWERAHTWGRQLRSTSLGFVVTEPDLSSRAYEAKFVDSSNYPYYLLTKLVTREGAVLAEVSYAAPTGTTNCPSSSPPGGQVAPYISAVTLAGGHLLKFKYSQSAPGNPCPLASIDYLAPPGTGSGVELVSYSLAGSPAGRVS